MLVFPHNSLGGGEVPVLKFFTFSQFSLVYFHKRFLCYSIEITYSFTRFCNQGATVADRGRHRLTVTDRLTEATRGQKRLMEGKKGNQVDTG